MNIRIIDSLCLSYEITQSNATSIVSFQVSINCNLIDHFFSLDRSIGYDYTDRELIFI